MSNTTAGLLHQESVKLAELYLETDDWNEVRQKVLLDNLLQLRTLNASRRVCSEIISRLKKLTADELELLVHGNSQEQGYLLWLAICRRYRFIRDFAVEVIRERYITLKTDLSYEDFDSFLNKKADWHPELDQINPVTRKKFRQILFKTLREVGFITGKNELLAAMLGPRFIEVLAPGKKQDLLIFPYF